MKRSPTLPHSELEFSASFRLAGLGVDRSCVPDKTKRGDDGALRARLKALAHERRRFGYRRLHVLLRREGWTANRKRVQRL